MGYSAPSHSAVISKYLLSKRSKKVKMVERKTDGGIVENDERKVEMW